MLFKLAEMKCPGDQVLTSDSLESDIFVLEGEHVCKDVLYVEGW